MALGQHLQALALRQVWKDELHDRLVLIFSEVANALGGSFDSAYLMAGGFGFGAAPASTGAAAGDER